MGKSQKNPPAAAAARTEKTSSPPGRRVLLAGMIGALTLALVLTIVFPGGREARAKKDFDDLVEWMRGHGTSVHQGLKMAWVDHGGSQVRGIITDQKIEPGTVILRIPSKLWLGLDSLSGPPASENSFEPIDLSSNLDKVAECFEKVDKMSLMLIIKLAYEINKGSYSEFAPYFATVPTLHDYQSSHPFWADADLRSAFHELPLMRIMVKEHQEYFKPKRKACIDAWFKAEDGSLAGLQYEDLLAAGFLVLTRTLGDRPTNGPPVKTIVPYFDLINTAGGQVKPNAAWFWANDNEHFEVGTLKDIPAGGEVLVQYCKSCDNEVNMAAWGMYLEDNLLGLNQLADVNCSALRQVALPELDTSRRGRGWLSPRCHKNSEPLRCSLARLSWETCAQEWGISGWFRRKPDKDSPAALRMHEEANNNNGLVLRDKGDLHGALKLFKAASRANPAATIPKGNIARTMRMLENPEADQGSEKDASTSQGAAGVMGIH